MTTSSEDHSSGLRMAEMAALQANCKRSHVGAVILSSAGRIIGVGWNAAPLPTDPQCEDGFCPRGLLSLDEVAPLAPYVGKASCIAVHAEDRAIRRAKENTKRVDPWLGGLEGGTIYVTRKPCQGCFVHIADSGLSRVIYPEGEVRYGA